MPMAIASSGVEMHKARDLGFAELNFDTILEDADELHPLIHPQQFVFTDVHTWSLLHGQLREKLPRFIA